MAGLFEEVVGQAAAVAFLERSARRPLHAYLFVGPPGTGKRRAARAFAAALLCGQGGCGQCRDCQLALAGSHPDLVERRRTGPAISVEEARELVRLARRPPAEGRRQVMVVEDLHLVGDAGPVLLKTLEEPPATTCFVLIADHVPPELATVASRCARVDFAPLPAEVVRARLLDEGVDPSLAAEAARGSGGSLDRARSLAGDPGFEARARAWAQVPERLDGTGAQAARVADELLAATESALEALRSRQAAELARLEDQARLAGERGLPGRAEVLERHRRQQRRAKVAELRFGLATLAASYRDRLATAGPNSARAHLRALEALEEAGRALARNPNEALLLQALMVSLSELAGDRAPAG
jgi:DNA polymerase-3 subunit delta'